MKNVVNSIKQKHAEYATYSIWLIGWLSVFGSLYFSEISKFVPCELCWWQRLLIYPLAIFATVAIVRKDYNNFVYYALPFGLIGMLLSAYHSLLQWGIIEHNILDCSERAAVPCSNPEIMIFGFITIPFLAFLAFFAVSVVSAVSIYFSKQKQTN